MFSRTSSFAASILRFALLAVPFVATAHCSSAVLEDGDTSAASTKEQQDAAAAAACPDGLVDVVRSDEKSGFLTFKVSDSCLNSAKGTLKDHVALESYLSKHPFTQLGKGEHFLMTCDTKYEIARRTDITQEQRRSVASNYYFLMNSLKQAALSTMESVAGLDMLVRPGQEPLQEIKGKRYSHPLLHESGDWEKRLKRNCRGEQARYDELVASTAMVVWNVRKLNAAIREHQAGIGWCGEYPSAECIEEESKHWKAVETLTKTRKAIVASAAPWLDGKKMSSLQSGSLSIGDVVKTENAYKLVDDQGVMQPRDKWHMAYHVDNPMNVIEKEIRAVFPAQLELNREGMMRKLDDYMKAADFLHGNKEARISQYKFQEIMDGVDPFDVRVFANYYGSQEARALISEQALTGLVTRADDLAAKNPTATMPTPMPNDGGRVDVTIANLQAKVAALVAAKVDVGTLGDEVDAFNTNFIDKLSSLSAEAALASAECRTKIRSANQSINDAKHDFVVGAAITVATAGMGSWLAAVRAANVAGQSAKVGLAWAQAAKVSTLAARGAQAATSVVSYQNQARILWGSLLAADAYWLGEGIVSSVMVCNEALNKTMSRSFDRGIDMTQVSCLEGSDPLSHQAIADYKSCAINAALAIGLNAIAILPAAREIKHGPLPVPKPTP